MERAELARLLDAPPGNRTAPQTFLEQSGPEEFKREFAAAVATGGDIFLCDPRWGEIERSQVAALVGTEPSGERGWLMIPTGGSGGRVKFARHDGFTLAAAVRGFQAHFGLAQVNSVGLLPLHHISGLMAWMRSVMTGGEYLPWDWKEAEASRLPEIDGRKWCVSLVPTQLQRLLASDEATNWLHRFEAILVGGGPSWDGLLARAADLGIPLAPSYGATETAAMIAAVRPAEFLAGDRTSGRAMPHAHVSIDSEGLVRVSGDSVFRGYYPTRSLEREWTSGDLGVLGPTGSLSILGRADDVIITGGKKVWPAEVEAVLLASGEFGDVAVMGMADSEWGQAVVAFHPANAVGPDRAKIEEALLALAPFKHPKAYVPVNPWPRTAQGKLIRSALAKGPGKAVQRERA